MTIVSEWRGVVVALLLATSAAPAVAQQTIVVPPGGRLQEAIDLARPGDTIELAAGATYIGNFTLRAKPGAQFITIRSFVDDKRRFPAGVRIRPAAAAQLATLRSPNDLPVLQTEPGAHHWRLLLLAFGPNATPGNDIIRFGDGSRLQTTRELVPWQLEIDRCYLYGDPTAGQKRGLALNSAETRILNSHFADFKLIGQDSQAIAGWNGPGPYLIENNYLEAAGSNVLFGGADPAIEGLVPSDITFRDNHVAKPTAWRGERWQVKNLFELKNARRVVIEDNLFEFNWQAAQAGSAILFTPRNQDGASPWTVVRDVMFRRNVVRHVAAAFNILGVDNNFPSERTTGISIHQNLIVDVNSAAWGGNGVFLLIGDGPERISVDHNTVMQTGAAVSLYGRPVRGFTFTNNVVRYNGLGIHGASRAPGNDTIGAFLQEAVISHNVFGEGVAATHPPNNHFPSGAVWMAQFRDYLAGDYGLSESSAYRGAGSDGTDIGVHGGSIARALAAPHGRHP